VIPIGNPQDNQSAVDQKTMLGDLSAQNKSTSGAQPSESVLAPTDGTQASEVEAESDKDKPAPQPVDPSDTPSGSPVYGLNDAGEVVSITQKFKRPDGSTYTVTINLVPTEPESDFR